MDMEKYIRGVINASSKKRYETFLKTAADLESVWVLANSDGFATYSDEQFCYLLVWPRKEFAYFGSLESDEPTEVEVHDFIKLCQSMGSKEKIMVFPTEKDAYVVSSIQMIEDLESRLSEVE